MTSQTTPTDHLARLDWLLPVMAGAFAIGSLMIFGWENCALIWQHCAGGCK